MSDTPNYALILHLRNSCNEVYQYAMQIAENSILTSLPTTVVDYKGLIMSFLLSCLVGYYVIWQVKPSLHSVLMSLTNAISSVIIIGALYALEQPLSLAAYYCALTAVFFATINIVGGFVITERMLGFFNRRD